MNHVPVMAAVPFPPLGISSLAHQRLRLGPAHEQRYAQHRRQAMALALAFAKLRHLSGKTLPQRTQLLRAVLAATAQRLLVRLQGLGQA